MNYQSSRVEDFHTLPREISNLKTGIVKTDKYLVGNDCKTRFPRSLYEN